jgi:hypothetical protein
MTFLVRRTNITGMLDEHITPIEVIRQCMLSHGLEPVPERLDDISDVRYRRKCIQRLMSMDPILIKDPRRAARYVNPLTTFTSVKVLMGCVEYLHQWETRENIEIDETTQCGPITEESPRSFDCTILFKICKRKGLQTKPSTTTEDMFRMIMVHNSISSHILQDYLIDRLQTMSSTELINHFSSLLPAKIEDLGRKNLCSHYLKTRESVTDPLGLFLPVTDHEAVIMTARMFRLNISKSSIPKMEFALLFKQGPDARSFPIDSKLQEITQRDSYALRLDQRFDPDVPEDLYKPEHLRKMAVEEGWTPEDLSPYDYLQLVHNSLTFFAFGRGPMSTAQPSNTELMVERDVVSQRDPLDLVLFGARNDPGGCIAISWGELMMTFDNYREFRNVFTNPSEKSLFETHVIRKLVILAKKPCIDQTIAEKRKRLVAIVEKIHLETKARMKYLNGIRETLLTNQGYQDQFRNLLDTLYRLSLCMRSLKTTEPLPESGEGGSLDYETTQLNTSVLAIKLDDMIQESSEWVRDVFLNLPLVIYYPSENKFSTSETSFEGHTIGGRLKIIHAGESTTAVSSCLRLSSNWFLSTVYYYQSFFHYPQHFDITKIVHIG